MNTLSVWMISMHPNDNMHNDCRHSVQTARHHSNQLCHPFNFAAASVDKQDSSRQPQSVKKFAAQKFIASSDSIRENSWLACQGLCRCGLWSVLARELRNGLALRNWRRSGLHTLGSMSGVLPLATHIGTQDGISAPGQQCRRQTLSPLWAHRCRRWPDESPYSAARGLLTTRRMLLAGVSRQLRRCLRRLLRLLSLAKQVGEQRGADAVSRIC